MYIVQNYLLHVKKSLLYIQYTLCIRIHVNKMYIVHGTMYMITYIIYICKMVLCMYLLMVYIVYKLYIHRKRT